MFGVDQNNTFYLKSNYVSFMITQSKFNNIYIIAHLSNIIHM